MYATDIMVADLVTVSARSPLLDAIDLMLDHGLSALPVVDEAGKPVGVLSETDLLCRAELETGAVDNDFWSRFTHQKCAQAYARLNGRQVSDVMTAAICCVAPDASMATVVAALRTHDIRRVYVTTGDALLGVVSEKDIMRALRDILKRPQPEQADIQIAESLREQLRQAPWAPRGVHPDVSGGHVIWRGVARDMQDIAALRAMAESVPGVRSVEDKLFLLSPGSGYTRES